MRFVGVLFTVTLILATIFLGFRVVSLSKQSTRLKMNQSALLSDIEFYKIDSARTAASIVQLRLTAEELENSNSSLKQDVEKLNIKLKRLNSASSTAIKSEYKIETVIRDSVRIIDSIKYHDRSLEYHTPYISISGFIDERDNFSGTVLTRDSLVRVEHRVPKKFLFFKCGIKFTIVK